MKQFLYLDKLYAGLNGDEGHKRKSAFADKRIVTDLQYLIKNHKPKLLPYPGKTTVRVDVVRYCRQRMDRDNVMSTAKFILDALVNEGIFHDDHPKYCWLDVYQVVIKKSQNPCTTVIIQPADVDEIYASRMAYVKEQVGTE